MRNQPFHDGEIAVQERAGERDIARRHGAAISSRIVPGALSFLARQRLLALSAAGDDGHLWTSVWCGEPGLRAERGWSAREHPAFADDGVSRRSRAAPPGHRARRGHPRHRVRIPASPPNQRDDRGHLGRRNRRPSSAKAFPTAPNTSSGASHTTRLRRH